MIGYKIFEIEDGKFYSYIVVGRCRVRYKKRGWTKQKKKKQGPFAVFLTKEAANLFLRNNKTVYVGIKKVKYKPSKEKQMWMYNPNSGHNLHIRDAPFGTRLAKAIKII